MARLLLTVFLLALSCLAIAQWKLSHEATRRAPLSWRQELEAAQEKGRKGDLYGASKHYNQAVRHAAFRNDWEALVRIACELHRLGNLYALNFNPHALLVRALVAAEKKKSAEGLRAVAQAFRALGESYASLALSWVKDDWSNDRETAVLQPYQTLWRCVR